MKRYVVEHHIQRDILKRLSENEWLRFSDLKSKEMESNIFMYHLHELIKRGYVQKRDRGYSLGLNGLRYTDNIVSSVHFVPAQYPKPIAIVVLQNSKSELLMTHRLRQPYINTHMFLSGKQHFGEDPLPHAQRELLEKIGLTNIPLTRRGLADFRIRNVEGNVITHIIGHVYSGTYDGPVPKSLNDRYAFVWFAPTQLKKLNLLAGTSELYDTMQENKGKLFFTSRDFQI